MLKTAGLSLQREISSLRAAVNGHFAVTRLSVLAIVLLSATLSGLTGHRWIGIGVGLCGLLYFLISWSLSCKAASPPGAGRRGGGGSGG